jgi:hypothetical protein
MPKRPATASLSLMSSFKHVTPISPNISLQHGNDQSAASDAQIRDGERFKRMDWPNRRKVVTCNFTMF